MSWVQILDAAACISLCTKTLKKATRGSPYGIVANVCNYDIIVSQFELQSPEAVEYIDCISAEE